MCRNLVRGCKHCRLLPNLEGSPMYCGAVRSSCNAKNKGWGSLLMLHHGTSNRPPTSSRAVVVTTRSLQHRASQATRKATLRCAFFKCPLLPFWCFSSDADIHRGEYSINLPLRSFMPTSRSCLREETKASNSADLFTRNASRVAASL